MSRRLEVLAALKALASAALPGADVKGLDNKAAFPTVVPANGLVIVREGDPGTPEVDLSPLSYNYDHRIPLEIAGYQTPDEDSSVVLDRMTGAIGAAIQADRTLGGLCDWLEAEAPNPEDLITAGANPPKTVILMIVASYATPDPLN